jgi:SAM-dependent methyltransferase
MSGSPTTPERDTTSRAGAANVAVKCYANPGNPPVVDAVPEAALSVLDVGCGAGDNARLLHQRGKLVDGITLSDTEAQAAGQWCRRVFVADLEAGLPPAITSETYDACICSHVLEHLRWPGHLLRHIRPRLAPGQPGMPQLVVALPNIMSYKTRWPLVMGRFDYAEGGIMDASHFRWFTFESGRRLLEDNGFRVLRSFGTGHFPLAALRHVIPRGIQQMIDSLAVSISPPLFATQMVFIARSA